MEVVRPAFLKHAVRSLSTASSSGTLSTTHKGVAFEERSLALLEEHLSMSLRRVGGKDDGGIDLLGWWWLPTCHSRTLSASASPWDMTKVPFDGMSEERRRLRVIAQCKDEKRKVGPKYVRELEGVLYRYMADARLPRSEPLTAMRSTSCTQSDQDNIIGPLENVVGLLISSAPFTKASMLRAQSSIMPLVLLHIPPNPLIATAGQDFCHLPGDHSKSHKELHDRGSLGSLVFNGALASGLLGNKLQPRWEHSVAHIAGGRPALWFDGRRVRSWTPECNCRHVNEGNIHA